MMVLFYPDGSLTFSLLAIADLRGERIGEIFSCSANIGTAWMIEPLAQKTKFCG
jgi:hypothetical protein